MIDDQTLNEWKRLAEAATPGPWQAKNYGSDGVDAWLHLSPTVAIGSDHAHWLTDATFIAAARVAVPALLAEVERLRAELASGSPGGSSRP